MARKIKWNSGPPPSIGWWPASIRRDPNYLRWWDGLAWSCAAPINATADRVVLSASRPEFEFVKIEWRERPASWPKRSRT